MRHTLPVSLTLLLLTAFTALAACSPGARGLSSSSATVLLPKPTETTIVTEPAQVVGIWQIYSAHCAPGYMLIRSNGTYTWSCQPDGSDGLSGKYHFSNGKFLLLNDLCGAEGRYQIHGSEPAVAPRTLTFTVVKDDCEAEIKTLTTQKAVWVSALP
jgi:hypothetical protein